MPQRIARADERLIVARMFLSIARLGHQAHLSHIRFGSSLDYFMIFICVFIGHLEGKPMAASKIAAYLDLPRATVQRRLAELVRSGAIERQKTHYCLAHEDANSPQSLECVKKTMRIVSIAFQQLLKTGTILLPPKGIKT